MGLEANFATEEACRAYLARLRFVLSPLRVGQSVAGARLVGVRDVGCQTSVTAGTIFEDTRIPLPVWFRAT